jgi:hypothetical protein
MKECHCLRDCILLKEWFEKKELKDIDPRKGDRAIRVCLRDVISNMHV